MHAFTIDRYSSPLRLRDIAEPIVGEHDVLVEISAASINHLDTRIIAGEFKQILPYPLPLVLGHDLAGIVAQIGPSVTRFSPGDIVFGRVRDGRIGTFADRIAVDERDLAIAPSSTNLEEAASLPLVSLTAWQALVESGRVHGGQRVLVHAGAGSVGSIAIQLAKHLGAHVATTVSADNADFVRALGADIVIDRHEQAFDEVISGYDFVLDSLGGQDLERSLRVLGPGGKAVSIAGPPTPAFARSAGLNPVVRAAMAGLSAKVRRLAKQLDVSYDFLFVRSNGEQLSTIAQLVDSGALRPTVRSVHPFEETAAAVDELSSRGRGKIVISHG